MPSFQLRAGLKSSATVACVFTGPVDHAAGATSVPDAVEKGASACVACAAAPAACSGPTTSDVRKFIATVSSGTSGAAASSVVSTSSNAAVALKNGDGCGSVGS